MNDIPKICPPGQCKCDELTEVILRQQAQMENMLESSEKFFEQVKKQQEDTFQQMDAVKSEVLHQIELVIAATKLDPELIKLLITHERDELITGLKRQVADLQEKLTAAMLTRYWDGPHRAGRT